MGDSRDPSEPSPPDGQFVLASGSPRRAEILERLEVDFDVVTADVDETALDGEDPVDTVLRLATDKAGAVAAEFPGRIVVAADTLVVLDGEALGKPHHPDAAAAMLRRLVGRSHDVVTGVCVHGVDGQVSTIVDAATVTMADVGEDELDWYVATGEALDKAGAYAVQGVGALLVERVTGDPTTVIGLPFRPTVELLRAAGVDWP